MVDFSILFETPECQMDMFMNACKKGDIKLVNNLIPFVSKEVKEAIYGASLNGHIAVVDRLLQEPTNRMFRSAIVINTFRYGHVDVANSLILEDKTCVDPSFIDEAFLMSNNIDVITKLVQGVNSSNVLFKKLINAIQGGRIDIVDVLLHNEYNRIDPLLHDNEAFFHAIQFGRSEIVDLLLQDDTNHVYPNARHKSALQTACEYGHIQIVKRLLQEKDNLFDPYVNNNQTFYNACRWGHIQIAEILLQYPKILVGYSSAFIALCYCEKESCALQILEKLLQNKDNRFNPSVDGNKIFQIACKYKRTTIVERLLKDPRVDPTANDNYAYRISIKNNFVDIINLLFKVPNIESAFELGLLPAIKPKPNPNPNPTT